MERLVGILGLLTLLGLAYAFSTDRRAVKLKTVLWGLALQIGFAILVLRVETGRRAVAAAGEAVRKLLSFSYAGSEFMFGQLGQQSQPLGFYFAFMVLPTIIFVAAFFSVLYHFGIMQVVVRGMAWVMTRLMDISGAESLNAAANIFMGQTEAPLTVRPFLPHVTRSELMTIMTAGFASVSGGILAAYVAVGIDPKHLLSAVIMTAPASVVMAKILVPETEEPVTKGQVEVPETEELRHENVLGAISRGTTDGLYLALNVAAMLIAFLALLALINGVIGGLHGWLGGYGIPFPESLQQILGWFFAPIAWLLGVSWKDASAVGQLLGTRMVANELVAFPMLAQMRDTLDPRSAVIATYALTGFANISSIGIQIGGIGALAPEKKNDLAALGFRAMLAGTMANMVSAAIVGILL